MRFLKLNLYLLPCLIIASCATGSQNSDWTTKVDGKHPLVGMIWDVQNKKFISKSELVSSVAKAKYAILGEKHDNPDHHRLQAEIVDGVGNSGRKAILGFEQIDVSKRSALDAHFDINPWSSSGIGSAVGWKKSGWPSFEMYEPIMAAGLKHKMRIKPLNLSRKMIQRVSKSGLSTLDDNLYRQMGLEKGIPNSIRLPLIEELRASHCYMVPDRAIGRLVRVQRAKDAFMANEAYERGKTNGAILIVGAGHARKEWGIPKYLRKIDQGSTILSLAFMEVKSDYEQAELYVDSNAPYDYIWFSPRLDNVDPCKKYRDQLKKFKKKKRSKKSSKSKKSKKSKKSNYRCRLELGSRFPSLISY